MLHDIVEMLRRLVEQAGSDLILRTGHRAVARLDGRIQIVSDMITTDDQMNALLDHLLNERDRERYIDGREFDMAAAFPGVGRFRANLL